MLINNVANSLITGVRRGALLLLAAALAVGGFAVAGKVGASVDRADSVRITSVCEGPDREHILC